MASYKYRLIELKHILKERVLVRKIASRSKALGKPAADVRFMLPWLTDRRSMEACATVSRE